MIIWCQSSVRKLSGVHHSSSEKLLRIHENPCKFCIILDNLTIINEKYTSVAQCGKGSYHNTRDLPSNFSGWESRISTEINRLKKISKKQIWLT